VAAFSSRGPGLSGATIKPILSRRAPAFIRRLRITIPNGNLYSANRYVGVDGTSFAAAIVAVRRHWLSSLIRDIAWRRSSPR